MLRQLIDDNSTAIASRWFEEIVAGYPDQTGRFLRGTDDPFANPVGSALRDETLRIVNGLAAGSHAEEMAPALDRIIRVRAIQEMPPAEAVGFVFALKGLVRRAVADAGPVTGEELGDVDAWIDTLALVAFTVYAACREEIYSIRVKEIHNRSLKMMERLNAWRERRVTGSDVDAAEDS